MTVSADSQPMGTRRAERAGLPGPAGSRLIDGWWAATMLTAVAGMVLTAVSWSGVHLSDAFSNLATSAAAAAYATLGALIVRRVRNPVGWLLTSVGAGLGTMALLSAYAAVGIIRYPGALPAAVPVGAVSEWVFFPVVAGFALTLFFFPSGTLPSRRWRSLVALNLVATGLLLIAFAVVPRHVGLPAPGGISLTYENPFGIPAVGRALSAVPVGNFNAFTLLSVLFLTAASVSLVVRYRAGGAELRRQISWVALSGIAFALLQLVALVAIVTEHGKIPVIATVAYEGTAAIALFGLPAVIAIGILKYRLYEIDVIINRTVTYGLLSAVLTAVYAGIVVGIGTLAGYAGGPVLTVAAAVVIAVLFQPVRHRARLVANRLVYGQRATPYQVLADFAEDMAGQLDVDAALDRMTGVLAAATGAVRAEVWVRVGAELRPRATWPPGSEPPAAVSLTDSAAWPAFDAATRAVPVRHSDELLGAITLRKSRSEPVSAAEDKLLTHLASQAGLVLRNARLTAELRATIDDLTASRRRLVRAQDEERHRIERDLHDGAQQQLVALAVQLTLLEDSAGDPAEVRHAAGQLRVGLHAALDELRALARGIYPPLLADRGLPAALQAQAGKAPLPVLIEADGIGRYRRDAEAAAYFCILEALQNTAKYARASRATVILTCSDSHLEFTVTDDGDGFDPAQATHGTGLQGMADRLAAAGGALRVRSAPGLGTTITGALPVSASEGPPCSGDAGSGQ